MLAYERRGIEERLRFSAVNPVASRLICGRYRREQGSTNVTSHLFRDQLQRFAYVQRVPTRRKRLITASAKCVFSTSMLSTCYMRRPGGLIAKLCGDGHGRGGSRAGQTHVSPQSMRRM